MTAPNNPSASKKKFESPTEPSKESLEHVIHEARSLADQYVKAKRTELEQYADQALEIAQTRLVSTIDTSLRQLGDSFEKNLNRGREALNKFVLELSKSVQAGVKQIDEKPVIPLFASLVGGCLLGIFLGTRVKRGRAYGSPNLKKAA